MTHATAIRIIKIVEVLKSKVEDKRFVILPEELSPGESSSGRIRKLLSATVECNSAKCHPNYGLGTSYLCFTSPLRIRNHPFDPFYRELHDVMRRSTTYNNIRRLRMISYDVLRRSTNTHNLLLYLGAKGLDPPVYLCIAAASYYTRATDSTYLFICARPRPPYIYGPPPRPIRQFL